MLAPCRAVRRPGALTEPVRPGWLMAPGAIRRHVGPTDGEPVEVDA